VESQTETRIQEVLERMFTERSIIYKMCVLILVYCINLALNLQSSFDKQNNVYL